MVMIDFVRKYQVIIWLSFVVVIMTVIKLTYQAPVVVDELRVVEIVPSVTPTPTVADTSGDEKDDNYPLWNLLPYKGTGFTVDHYVSPGVLVVYLEGIEKNKAKMLVEGWMESNGAGSSSQTIEWRTK